MKLSSKIAWSVALGCATLVANAYNPATTPAHFYARIDMGAVWLQNQSLKSTIGSPPLPAGTTATSEAKISSNQALIGQLGFGYIFSPYWRMDLTGTQTGSFNLTSSCVTSSVCPANTKGSGDLQSGQLLVNAYLDFGQLFGANNWFNPYVGVGIGAAHNKIGKFSSEADGQEVSSINSHSSNSFAWRAMGGIGLMFTRHWALDLSYAYTDAGSVDSGSEVTIAGSGDQFELAKPGSINVNLQDVMLGVRYRF